MRTLTEEQKPNWPTYVPSLVYAYNSTPHASTGFQPYEANVQGTKLQCLAIIGWA